MWKNYFTVAWRHLWRHKGYTTINVLGLAVGMACCILIGLYVHDELSYDHHHEHADRIARLTRTSSVVTAAPMAPALARDLPGVEEAARIAANDEVPVVRDGEQAFKETVYAADSSIFDIFSFPFIRGDAETALRQPEGVLLTETTARKFFGEEDPLGEPLTVHLGEPVTFTVTGVLEDLPRRSHFHFDLLASFKLVEQHSSRIENWRTNWLNTYLLLARGTTAEEVEARLPAFFERHVGEAWSIFRVQPLLDIRLHSAHLDYDIAPQGNAAYVLLFAAIAALILLIACINFTNLATTLSLRRAREVGMRKALGAKRTQLVAQHLGESLLLAALALGLAAVFVSMLLPVFRDLTGKDLMLAGADLRLFLGGSFGLALLAGLMAGSYPALFLSALRPANTLKGTTETRAGGGMLRKGLVASQFAISIFLIVGTLVIYGQVDYLKNARLGFEKEQTVVLPFGEALADRHELVKREVARHPNVLGVTATGDVPGHEVSDFLYRPEGWTQDDLLGWDTYFVDADYVQTLGMEVVQGRTFSPALASDSNAFLLNESAAEALAAQLGAAWTNPVGKQVDFLLPGREGWEVARSGPVVGVVKDFHYRSMHSEIGPLVMLMAPQAFDHLLVKVRTDDLAGTLAFLEEQWQALGPSAPFAYDFLDDTFDRLYRTEERIGTLFGLFAALAIFIACLGLFGLAALTAQQRTKEIGVRKVLGASVASIVALLSKDFVKLVLLAFVIAAPVAYVATQRWLEGFAYRIEIGPWIFLGAGTAALLLALLTVGYQAIKAALADPVESLRYE